MLSNKILLSVSHFRLVQCTSEDDNNEYFS